MVYYLSLGSNLGERETTIERAITLLPGVVARSAYYYSEPQDFVSPHPFCNCCVAIETDLAPLDLLHLTQSIERQLGRRRKSVHGQHFDREIDIDILLAYPTPLLLYSPTPKTSDSGLQIRTANLHLPHPKMLERDFVMVPLREILPLNEETKHFFEKK